MSETHKTKDDGRRQAEPGPTTALLLIDVINDLAFDGGEALLQQALPMAHAIVALKERARQAGIPVIYVNDNFGHWQSDFQTVVDYCMRPEAPGRTTTALLRPQRDDFFVIKPRHSGFYQTSLELLLKYLKVQTLILTGMAADMCVLFTANDAYLREFQIVVPADCCAAESEHYRSQALELIARVLKADITPSAALDIAHTHTLAHARRSDGAGSVSDRSHAHTLAYARRSDGAGSVSDRLLAIDATPGYNCHP